MNYSFGIIKKIAFLGVPIIFAGCGGGGGGTTFIPTLPEQDDTTYDPSWYETTEYKNQYGLETINASQIYSDGGSGKGVTVAVIDTGVDVDHADLAGNIATGGWDYMDNDSNASANGQGDYMSHGTHVAGIIAATRDGNGMHGVAWNAKILALRAGDSDGDVFTSHVNSSIDRAISQGARVINASFGGTTITDTTANKWLSAHNNGLISVHSAGNSYVDNGNGSDVIDRFDDYNNNNPLYGARLPIESGYEALANTLIAVVATDKSNDIASFSNRCGDAKEWCMAAPGVSIYSTVDSNDNKLSGDYATFSGSSMAAPHVSGAVATLLSRWSSKTAAEIVTILYDTATDLGAVGTDAIYGRGLLNLYNATSAQGALTVETESGDSYAIDESGLSTSGTLGGSVLGQSFATAVFDKYKRDFYFNLNNAVSTPSAANIADEMGFRDSNISTSLDADTLFMSNIEKRSIQIQNTIKGYQVSFSSKQDPSLVFAFNQKDDVLGLSDAYSLYGDSHLAQINNANIINITSNGAVSASLGAVSGYTDNNNQHAIGGVNASFLTSPSKHLKLTAQLSFLQEDETFLSNYFSGAYQTGEAITGAVNLIAESKLSNTVNFISQYSVGSTRVETLSDSAVSDFSTLGSSGYSLSLKGRDVYAQGDRLFATFKQPMVVYRGDMTLTTADGLNADDSIRFTDNTINLAPEAREKVFTLGYVSQQGSDTSITWLLNYQDNPNHDASLDAESSMLLKIRKQF